MQRVTKSEDERQFIVMTAKSKEWQFAQELNFYEEGILLQLMVI
jgi:hypothetical protein